MSSTANASAEVIEKFRRENDGFVSSASTFKSIVYSAISELKGECDKKVNAYSAMASEAEQLLTKARQKQANAQKQASAASARLASTPKTVKETYTDSDGNERTREKPNPAYGAAQAEASQAKARSASAASAVANVVKTCEQIRARYAELQAMSRSIAQLSTDVIPQIDRAIALAQSVDGSLQNAIRAVREYLDYVLR